MIKRANSSWLAGLSWLGRAGLSRNRDRHAARKQAQRPARARAMAVKKIALLFLLLPDLLTSPAKRQSKSSPPLPPSIAPVRYALSAQSQ